MKETVDQLLMNELVDHTNRVIAERDCLLETVKWIASQQNLFFAECSQAEEIVERCRKALEFVTNRPK